LVNNTPWCGEMTKSPAPKSRHKPRQKSRRKAGNPASSLLVTRLRARLADARKQIADLKQRADMDALLDIQNRRGFERELRRSLAYVKRYGATAALLYLDVDGLKPINDGHGHAAGDAALKAIARELIDHVRMSDIVARLGGDEFGILLWNLEPADAEKKARALEASIDALPLTFRGRTLQLGISAGVTMLNDTDETADVLTRADTAMYQRKLERRAARRRRGAAITR
jgi:diguanylate cyclase (GGDEF)-like protein